MARRAGSLLEEMAAKILSLAGMQPELNKFINTYEIDVYCEYKGLRIGFECKQYETSGLTVRNLVHQWDSKRTELDFDGFVLILYGIDVTEEDILSHLQNPQESASKPRSVVAATRITTTYRSGQGVLQVAHPTCPKARHADMGQ